MNRAIRTWLQCADRAYQEGAYPTECTERLESAGYAHLGGSTRHSFVTPGGDRVVKLDRRGLFNRREVEMSARGIDVLVPVLDHGADHRWLTMPRVETRSFNQIPWSDVKEVKRGLRDAGWECRDIRRPNIGYMDGRPVAFDYAEGCSRTGGDFDF